MRHLLILLLATGLLLLASGCNPDKIASRDPATTQIADTIRSDSLRSDSPAIANALPAAPAPAFFAGLRTAEEVLDRAGVNLEDFNLLITLLNPSYRCKISGSTSLTSSRASGDARIEARYDPRKPAKDRFSLYSIDGLVPEIGDDFGYEKFYSTNVTFSNRLQGKTIVKTSSLKLKRNEGDRAVVQFTFDKKTLPSRRAFVRHLTAQAVISRRGIEQVTLYNQKKFKALGSYRFQTLKQVSDFTRLPGGDLVVKSNLLSINGTRDGKPYKIIEKSRFYDFVKVN